MKKSIIHFMAGVLAGSILLSATVAYAAGGTLIEVFYNINDIVINNTSKMPTDNKPFIYNGTTYVPLRFVSENLGYGVDWDGSTGTVYIGNNATSPNAEEVGTYLGEGIKYLTAQGDLYAYSAYDGSSDVRKGNNINGINNYKINDNMGNEYKRFLCLVSLYSAGYSGYVEYALNAQYSRFKADVTLANEYKNTGGTARLNIYGDDRLLYTQDVSAGFLLGKIDVSVTGVVKLKIEIESVDQAYVGVILGNPRLTR